MKIEGYECGWLVDKPLAEEEADEVFKAIAGEVEFWGDGTKGRDYYKKGTCSEKKDVDEGKVTLLIIRASVDYKRPEFPRQILFYRDEGNGTFYLEGDVEADESNQVFFMKGLEKLCSIWGCSYDDFFKARFL